MLEIERVGWIRPRYAVRDDDGHAGLWARARFKEDMSGGIDGERYELLRDGFNHFRLVRSGRTLARADAGQRGRWTISLGDFAYELRHRSSSRSEMRVLTGDRAVGSIRRARALRGKIVCELPPELSPAAQTFIALIALTLWHRAAVSSWGP